MNYLIEVVVVLFVYYSILFFVGNKISNLGIVDIGWGLSFIITGLYLLFRVQTLGIRKLIIITMILLWGGRLSSHIFMRFDPGKEDARYKKIKENLGKKKHPKLQIYLKTFISQGVLSLLISTPVILILMISSKQLSVLDAVGIVIWCIGFAIEITADRQLKKFLGRKENEGRIMKEGLWRYSRHPNYFGESVMWIGIYIIALNYRYGVLTIISPITITVLLLFISGVPLIEKQYEDNEEFQNYKKETSVFIPWFKMSN